MSHDLICQLAGPHWPRSAASAAQSAQAAGLIDAVALRLVDRWYEHLAQRKVAIPSEVDFASFGSIGKLENLRHALALVAPGDLAPIRLALKAKRSQAWRLKHPEPETPANRRPRRRARMSVPLADLPADWQRLLHEMRKSRKALDAGLINIEDRTPPSTKVINNLESTLRVFGSVCLQNDLPVELTIEAFTQWRAARRAAGNRNLSIASRCKELAIFAAWGDMDEGVIQEIHERRRRHLRASKGVQKRKEEWMLNNDVGIGEVWLRAEELLEAAQGAPIASDLRARLTLDAACLALCVVAPLRTGDLHRIYLGKHLVRHADHWSLSIQTEKTGRPYRRSRLWPEITPFLDALILLDVAGSDPWVSCDASLLTRPLFSEDGGQTALGKTWISQVWTRHFKIGAHVIRSMWHQMMFESEDDEQYIALALCGQGHGRTAMHYVIAGNRNRAVRRGRAKIRAAREASIGKAKSRKAVSSGGSL